MKVLLESVLRQVDGRVITEEHVTNLAKWGTKDVQDIDVPFKPSRVIYKISLVFQLLLIWLRFVKQWQTWVGILIKLIRKLL